MQQPDTLKTLPSNSTLIDVSETVTQNYATYHRLAEQLKALQEWVQRIAEESRNGNGRVEGSEKEVR